MNQALNVGRTIYILEDNLVTSDNDACVPLDGQLFVTEREETKEISTLLSFDGGNFIFTNLFDTSFACFTFPQILHDSFIRNCTQKLEISFETNFRNSHLRKCRPPEKKVKIQIRLVSRINFFCFFDRQRKNIQC